MIHEPDPSVNRFDLSRDQRLDLWRTRKVPGSTAGLHLLSHTCPDCGRLEVSGLYCTYCFLPIYPGDRHKGETFNEEARSAAIARHGRLSERIAVELRREGRRGGDPVARQHDLDRRRASKAAGRK